MLENMIGHSSMYCLKNDAKMRLATPCFEVIKFLIQKIWILKKIYSATSGRILKLPNKYWGLGGGEGSSMFCL